jgi:hypothetical protein
VTVEALHIRVRGWGGGGEGAGEKGRATYVYYAYYIVASWVKENKYSYSYFLLNFLFIPLIVNRPTMELFR